VAAHHAARHGNPASTCPKAAFRNPIHRPSPIARPPAPAEKRRDGSMPEKERPHPDPTRYGDWEKNGRCIDF